MWSVCGRRFNAAHQQQAWQCTGMWSSAVHALDRVCSGEPRFAPPNMDERELRWAIQIWQDKTHMNVCTHTFTHIKRQINAHWVWLDSHRCDRNMHPACRFSQHTTFEGFLRHMTHTHTHSYTQSHFNTYTHTQSHTQVFHHIPPRTEGHVGCVNLARLQLPHAESLVTLSLSPPTEG